MLTPDMLAAIRSCLTWYFDQVYDPSPDEPGDGFCSPPSWVTTMIEEYAAHHGISGYRESWEFVMNEIHQE